LQGVPFQWLQLSDAQRAALDPGVASSGTPNRLNYLRGDRTNEITSAKTGMYRARISVLGDIVDSSPTWVGPPRQPLHAHLEGFLYPNNPAPENGVATYSQFVTSKQTPAETSCIPARMTACCTDSVPAATTPAAIS